MRNDIETREIDDTELDAVSGGIISVSGGLAGAVTSDVSGLVGVVGSSTPSRPRRASSPTSPASSPASPAFR